MNRVKTRRRKWEVLQDRAQGLKWCPMCKTSLPFSCFYTSKSEHDGLAAYCKECKNAHERSLKRGSDPVRVGKIKARKAAYVNLLGGCCCRCGYMEFLTALDFHHINPELKVYEITDIVTGATKVGEGVIYAELDKCALLCRNCHSGFHSKGWKADWVKRGGLGWELANADSLVKIPEPITVSKKAKRSSKKTVSQLGWNLI